MQIASFEDVKFRRKHYEVASGYRWNTLFFEPPRGVSEGAHAYYSESMPNRVLRTHYHDADEFQVIMHGGGTFGRHAITPYTVHYARAYTPYGPIVAGPEGLAFMTMRRTRHTDAYYLPEAREDLLRVNDRQPWQVSERAEFGGSLRAFRAIRDQHGLAAYSLRLESDASADVPHASTSGGQYLLVVAGSIVHGDKLHAGITVVFVNADDPPFNLTAGAHGADVIVLNFPRRS